VARSTRCSRTVFGCCHTWYRTNNQGSGRYRAQIMGTANAHVLPS
jgi:hypothetical protein